MSDTCQFNIKDEIVVGARPASAGGVLTDIAVRFPTDEEWTAYMRTKKIVVRDMGRGTNEHVPAQPGESDSKLFTAIALNGAPALTPAEAGKVLDQLGVSKTIDVRLNGVDAEVDLRILHGMVTHQMKIPTVDQVNAFQRACVRRLELPNNQHSISFNVMAGAQLYDDCGGKSGDYTGGVPALHKDAVARGVIETINRQLGPKQRDEDF